MSFQQSPNARQRSNTTPKTPTTDLFDEVAVLMRAFGDSNSRDQNHDSIILVERILVQQLRSILSAAIDVANRRTGIVVPSQCDFEFLMRRNPLKVVRLRKFLRSVSQLKAEQKQGLGLSFLNHKAEDNVSDEELYDAEKTRRILRFDRISQVLPLQKYTEFQNARTWSSNSKNKATMIGKLIEILQISKDIHENSNCLEILFFFGQETICTIVDYAILTRLNSDNQITEPVVISSSITNAHLCPEVTQGRPTLDGIKAITVQEINEAIRRIQVMSTKRMGTRFRSSEMKIPFLAL